MKRLGRRIFWFSLLLISLFTLIGTGPAVAETGSNVATHTTNSDCQYNVSDTKIGRAASSFTTPEELINNTRYTNGTHFATGDWLALQFPKSDTSNCSYGEPAGSNMAYADPATPGANTSHTIATEVNKTVTELDQISIRYEVQPQLKDGLSQSNVSAIGIDANKDGFIEQSLNESIEYITIPDPYTIQLSLDGNTTIPSGSYLIVRYAGIQNPDYKDTHRIKVTITGNTTVTDIGNISYGPDRTGLIGYNVGLSIDKNNSQLATLRSSKIGFTNHSMYLFLRIQQNISQPQTYSLSITNRSRSDSVTATRSNDIIETINVFDRYAYTFSNAEIKNGTITVQGYTNMAPGSRLSVRIFNSGRLVESGTIVEDSQTWSVTRSLPDELLNSRILRTTVIDINEKEIDQAVLFVT